MVTSAAFSPDSKRVVTASTDKTARLWDANTGRQIIELKGHGYLNTAAYSPDGKRIVTASLDSTARLWDANNGEQVGEPLTGHAQDVLSAAFSRDGKRIVTASRDGTARLWDADTGRQIGEPFKGHSERVHSATFSPDGKHIFTTSSTIRLWEIVANTELLISHAKAAIPRCLTPAQRKAFFLLPEPPLWCIELEKWPTCAIECDLRLNRSFSQGNSASC
jgi:WD40 repeat protein